MDESAEEAPRKAGLRVEDFDFGREDEPDVVGFASLEWLDLDHTEYVARLLVRPGTSAEDRAAFAEWCRGAVHRWVTSGPGADGWQRRETDAGWQLWCRRHQALSLDCSPPPRAVVVIVSAACSSL